MESSIQHFITILSRDVPNRDGPNRDEHNRDGPNRDEPNRDGPVTDETLICGKDVEHEDENVSGQNSVMNTFTIFSLLHIFWSLFFFF